MKAGYLTCCSQLKCLKLEETVKSKKNANQKLHCFTLVAIRQAVLLKLQFFR